MKEKRGIRRRSGPYFLFNPALDLVSLSIEQEERVGKD